MTKGQKIKGYRVAFLLPLLVLGFLTSACELSDEDKQALSDAFEPEMPPGTTPPTLEDGCVNERYVQPSGFVTKRLDILLVVDSSGSLENEKQIIADGVDALLRDIPNDVLFNVGVLLAHGDESPWSGTLFQNGAEPAVLSSVQLTEQQISDGIYDKLLNMPLDTETDGGEAGLYSLHKMLNNSSLLNQARSEGMFRSSAALAVVFISDENDICARYPVGVERVADPDGLELPAFDKYCANVTPESVAQSIKSVNGSLPLLVSTVTYEESSIIPEDGAKDFGGSSLTASSEESFHKNKDKKSYVCHIPGGDIDKAHTIHVGNPAIHAHLGHGDILGKCEDVLSPLEDEIGYGYLEVLDFLPGISVDLSSGTYDDDLSVIGSLADIKVNLITDFTLSYSPNSFDLNTLEVQVDGEPAEFVYSALTNSVFLPDPGQALSVIDINYCLIDQSMY